MRPFIAGIFLFSVVILYSACTSSRKTSRYFKTIKGDTTIAAFLKTGFEAKIQPGDNLGISINSLSPEENVKFNSLVISGSSSSGVPTYNVSEKGTIKMHKLGELPVSGLTRQQLADMLQDSLKPYLKQPLVNVSFLNHKMTVLGAVGRPQVINIPNEGISLMEVLAQSGDILPDGKKDEVFVIRDSANSKQVKKLDLRDHSVFASEWYYMMPNDVVYVVEDTRRMESEERRRRIQTTLSLVVSSVSLLVIIIDRLLR